MFRHRSLDIEVGERISFCTFLIHDTKTPSDFSRSFRDVNSGGREYYVKYMVRKLKRIKIYISNLSLEEPTTKGQMKTQG